MQRPYYPRPPFHPLGQAHYNQDPRQWTPGYRPRPPRGQFQRFQRPPHNFDRQDNHNVNYWCETCDRGFPNLGMLEMHKQQHQKCNVDGCQFVAHPKIITKHIQMQHSSGIFKKIAKLNNPEEISKWIEERKKKYPTKDNVELKAAQLKEQIERGEKIGISREKRNHLDRRNQNPTVESEFNRKQPHHQNQNNHKGFNSNTPNNKNYKRNRANKEKELPAIINNSKLKPFAGIQLLYDNLKEDDSEDDNMEETKPVDLIEDEEETNIIQQPTVYLKTQKSTEIIKPLVCGALSSLMDTYESSDEEAELTSKNSTISDGIKVHTLKEKSQLSVVKNVQSVVQSINIVEVKNTTNIEISSAPVNNSVSNRKKKESDDDSGPEEVKVVKSLEENNKNDISDQNNKHNCNKTNRRCVNNRNQGRRPVVRRPKPKIPSTLLRKLLQNEIRQERNTVLQCIRHIVKNNYFE